MIDGWMDDLRMERSCDKDSRARTSMHPTPKIVETKRQ